MKYNRKEKQIRICRDETMKTFDEVFIDKTKYGVKVQTSEYGEQGEHIIIDQGQSQIAGYTDREEGLFEEVPVVIFGDHTRVVKYVDEPFFLGADGVKVLRSKDEKANYKYLYYALKNAKIPNTGYNRHFKWLKEIQIKYPDSDKQTEIVDVLDKVSDIISKREAELQVLDELIKARFIEMFGDPNVEFKFPESKFKEYAKDMTKGPFGSVMKKDLFVPKGGDTYKVYIQANAIQGDQNIGDYYISKEYFDSKIFKFEVKPGDYIITCDGTLGKYLKLNEKMERGVISPSLLRITLDENKMTKEYFEGIWDMYMLLLMKKEARNACLIHLPSAKVIGEIDIPIPPFELQKEFSLFVKQVDKSKFAVQKALDEAQLLFESLMQKYFG